MDLNKRGLVFSILSLMIAVLIITIFTIGLGKDIETDIAQVNSRAELIESTFRTVELNLDSVVQLASKNALRNMAITSSYLYNNETYTPYDMTASCAFNSLMKGEGLRIFNLTHTGKNILFEMPGIFDYTYDSSLQEEKITSENIFIQEFEVPFNIYSNIIKLRTKSNPSTQANIIIKILNECKNEISGYDGLLEETPDPGIELTSTYTLDKYVEYLPGKKYYLYITSNDDDGYTFVYPQGALTNLLPYSLDEPYYNQSKAEEFMSEEYHGYTPTLNKTIVDYLDEVKRFFKNIYKIDSSYEVKELNIKQENPWEVIVDGNVRVSLNDSNFKVNKIISFEVPVSIVGLPDPMFSKYKEYREIKKFRPRIEVNYNYSDFYEAFSEELYVPDTRSPKFLDRFSSNFSRSYCCGFQTYYNPDDRVGMEDDAFKNGWQGNRSMVAWMLFTEKVFCEINSTQLYEVASSGNLPTDFNLDDVTLSKFNISDESSNIPEFDFRIYPRCS